MLYKTCNAFTEMYICINVLDKCKGLRKLLNRFTKAYLKIASICLICTGRPHIQSIINNCISLLKPSMISIKAHKANVQAFAEWRIEDDWKDNPRIINNKLKGKIIKKFLKVFQGVFVMFYVLRGFKYWCRCRFLLSVLYIGFVLKEDMIASHKDRFNSL